VLRHTFGARLAMAGVQPKVILEKPAGWQQNGSSSRTS
jgi:hypothetical protein